MVESHLQMHVSHPNLAVRYYDTAGMDSTQTNSTSTLHLRASGSRTLQVLRFLVSPQCCECTIRAVDLLSMWGMRGMIQSMQKHDMQASFAGLQQLEKLSAGSPAVPRHEVQYETPCQAGSVLGVTTPCRHTCKWIMLKPA